MRIALSAWRSTRLHGAMTDARSVLGQVRVRGFNAPCDDPTAEPAIPMEVYEYRHLHTDEGAYRGWCPACYLRRCDVAW
eukprot:1068234-Rhodomonas_salina.2